MDHHLKIACLFLFIPLVMISQVNLNRVEALVNDKQFIQAESLAKDYLETDANNLKAIELLGDIYGFQKRWDDAINAYGKLVDANPEVANYQYKYGGALGMKALSVSKIRALGIIGDVKQAFLKAAELDPNHIDARWALVELYMQLPGIFGGSKSASLKYANELEQLSKVDGYLAKGYIYEYDNEPELAETYYKKAIKETGSLGHFNKPANSSHSKIQSQKTIQNIQETQQPQERNALYYQIGKVAAQYNIELQKGEACLQTYLKNFSSRDGVPRAWAHYRLAQIYMYKKNKSEALKHIDLALAELPEIKPFKKEKEKILNL